MPVNKKALTRYLAYDKLLRNRGRRYTWKELVAEANEALAEEGLNGIGKTQFYEDIKYMQGCDWKAPIESEPDPSDRRIKYLFYDDPEYSISKQPLRETEAEHLKSAIMVLSRFKGLPQFEWINEIIPGLEARLGLKKTEKEVFSFDSNIDYEGYEYITPIFDAIINKQVLNITYQSFKNPNEFEITFHPAYLKQHNNRWFVFGINSFRMNQIQNLALDRIKNISEIREEYLGTNIDWDEYFADFIGVTRMEGSPVEVRIRILDEEQAAYIRTKPMHQTQKPVRLVENGYETSINVIPNYELEKLIMSFGDRIMVLSPEDFKTRIAERMRKGAKLYTVGC